MVRVEPHISVDLQPAVKRGRGRPRRYPRPEDRQTSNHIPAIVMRSNDGQTIMMAPIQVSVPYAPHYRGHIIDMSSAKLSHCIRIGPVDFYGTKAQLKRHL